MPDGTIKWTRVDGPPLAFAFEFTGDGTADLEAKRILADATRESGYLLKHVTERLSAVIFSRMKLEEYLLTPIGDHQVKFEPTEFASLWSSYLMQGRQLIDKLGDCIDLCFSLNEKRKKGLNAKGFGALRNIVEKKGQSREDLAPLLALLNQYESPISTFIALRDQEKIHKNTLKEIPRVNPDGRATGGIIRLADQNMEFELLPYFKESQAHLIGFTKAIHGIAP